MGTSLMWWSAVSLEVVVLLRGRLTGLLRKFPLFYAYIGCVLLKEIIGLLSYRFAPTLYEPLYWPAELATIVASYAVAFEIFRQTLRHNPGVARLTRKLLLIVLVLTLVYASSDVLHHGSASASRVIAELGRDLRYIEGALLLVMLWLFERYRVSIGRNLLGLILGYSFWVGLNVINLVLWFLPGNEFSVLLRRLLPGTYIAALAIWCLTLWSPRPDPAPPAESAIDRDYQRLAARTRAAFAHLSTRVGRTLRP